MDIYNKIANNEYVNPLKYAPVRVVDERSILSLCKTNRALNYDQAKEQLEAEHALAVAARDEYREKDQELHTKFCTDLCVEFGLLDHPFAPYLFSSAWERGHSAGYHDVAICFANLVDTFMPFIDKYNFVEKVRS